MCVRNGIINLVEGANHMTFKVVRGIILPFLYHDRLTSLSIITHNACM